MPAPTQTSPLQTFAAGGGNEIITLTSVAANACVGAIVATYRQDALLPHVASVTSSNGGALTSARSRTRNSQNAGGGNRLTLTVYLLPNAAAGTHTLTLVKGQTGTTFGSWFAFELPGVAPSSPVDIAIDASVDHPSPSVSIGPTAQLSQALEFAMAIVAGLGTAIFNGSSTPPSVAPDGFVAWRSYNQNSPLVGVPMQASYADLNSTAPLSATWTVSTDSIDDGYLAMIVTLKLSAGAFFVEVLLQWHPSEPSPTSLDGSAGWSVVVSPGVIGGAGTVTHTNVTAQPSGSKLHLPAPPGVTLNQQVNVIPWNVTLGYDASLDYGTVKAP